VKTGRHLGDHVEILDGLRAGERIVTSGTFLVDSESQLQSAAGGHQHD
jgi:membrane fusion protein, copper/silver efflux system